jgi:hypothetical protein
MRADTPPQRTRKKRTQWVSPVTEDTLLSNLDSSPTAMPEFRPGWLRINR